VLDGGLVDGMLPVIDLDHGREEGATLEVRLGEPVREDVEYRQQLLAGSLTAPGALGFQPIVCPKLLAPAQEFDNQVILRREIAVERHLRRPGPGDDGVHADGPDSFTAEKLISRPAHPLAPGVPPLVPGVVSRHPLIGHRRVIIAS
jgi:hypothetical protein